MPPSMPRCHPFKDFDCHEEHGAGAAPQTGRGGGRRTVGGKFFSEIKVDKEAFWGIGMAGRLGSINQDVVWGYVPMENPA